MPILQYRHSSYHSTMACGVARRGMQRPGTAGAGPKVRRGATALHVYLERKNLLDGRHVGTSPPLG